MILFPSPSPPDPSGGVAPCCVQRSLALFALGLLVSGLPGIRGRKLQVERDSDCGAPTKGLVELRECGSCPSFLAIAHSTCKLLLHVAKPGAKAQSVLCEGVCTQPPPSHG